MKKYRTLLLTIIATAALTTLLSSCGSTTHYGSSTGGPVSYGGPSIG